MIGERNARALRIWLITSTCALAVSLPVAAAGDAARSSSEPAQPVAQAQSQDEVEVLGEVIVEGGRLRPKPRTNKELQKPFDWLARLVGEFDIDGSVDVHAKGRPEDLREVSGRAECIGFGVGPAVQCDLRALWQPAGRNDGGDIPGGASVFNPAVMLFGFEPVLPGISYILVDGLGHAETAVGEMVTVDTMSSRSKCAAVAGNCERSMQITADADLARIDMQVVLRIENEPVVRFALVLRRVPGSVSVVYGRKGGRQ